MLVHIAFILVASHFASIGWLRTIFEIQEGARSPGRRNCIFFKFMIPGLISSTSTIVSKILALDLRQPYYTVKHHLASVTAAQSSAPW